jgi:Putative phage holin Dp-1
VALSNKLYGILKQLALIWLPAGAALYAGIAGIWGLGYVEQIVGTISAVDTFLGVALHISSGSYNSTTDGNLVVDKSDPLKDVYSLVLTTPIEKLDGKDSIKLAVVKGAA